MFDVHLVHILIWCSCLQQVTKLPKNFTRFLRWTLENLVVLLLAERRNDIVLKHVPIEHISHMCKGVLTWNCIYFHLIIVVLNWCEAVWVCVIFAGRIIFGHMLHSHLIRHKAVSQNKMNVELKINVAQESVKYGVQ